MTTEGGATRLRLALRCRSSGGSRDAPRTGEPVTCGVPFPRGALTSTESLWLVDRDRRRVPLQARTLDRWSDGSVRWALLDWLASVDARGGTYTLRDDAAAESDPASDLGAPTVGETASTVEVNTGVARFRMRPGGRFPFDLVAVADRPALDLERCGLLAEDERGREFSARVDSVRVAEAGAVRVTVKLIGAVVAEGLEPLVDLRVVCHFYRGSATVRLGVTVTNPRRAKHPGNLWELGDAGSVHLRDLALTLSLPRASAAELEGGRIRLWPEAASPCLATGSEVELYQDSSGGENWRSENHVDRLGTVPLRFRGYRLRHGEKESRGRRASPIVSVDRGVESLAVAPSSFWQEFPKAIEASAAAVTLRFWPRQSSDVHELQGGERKTHWVTVALAVDDVTAEPLAWCRSPLSVDVEPAWYATAEAAPHLLPAGGSSHRDYQRLVDQAIVGSDTFEDKREAIDEYGWRHFGDLWADHEAVAADGRKQLASHYNNQYDALAGCAIQFLRSGDRRWYEWMEAMAKHVADIDLYHTDRDKSAYNHGQFWHTVHHIDAGRSTHRSYPSAPGVSGGGPSGGHLYSSGLMLHYLLTGCELSREAVVALGRYVMDADDGGQSILRFVDRGRTGHVTLSGFDCYHGPGRGAANSLNVLVDAHRLSGERPFLDKAEELISRCIHPADDPAALGLLAAESRWFYTMFLQVLGKYLDHKAELGEIDRAYAYARASLVRYALWALEHEVPYLSRSDELEFPTETWAAQDMRKSEVFQLAARHTSGMDRRRLRKRAEFFYDYSVATLTSMPTRSLCRPVVIMLTCGYRQAWFEHHADDSMPRPSGEPIDFGRPRRFVTQRQRAKRKLLVGAGMLALAIAILLSCGMGVPENLGTPSGDVTVYHRLDFDDATGGFTGTGGARLELSEDAVVGSALSVRPRRPWAGARLRISIKGSRGLKLAFLAKGVDYPAAELNVFDRLADDNTTSESPRLLYPDRWTAALYSLDRFVYNASRGASVEAATSYESLRFFGPAEPTPRSHVLVDNLVLYRGTDATPPEPVKGLTASRVAGTVRLSWSPAEDNVGVMGYAVARRGEGQAFRKVAEVRAPEWLDPAPGADALEYRVFAFDFERNLGPWSDVEPVAAGAGAARGLPERAARVERLDAQRLREVHEAGLGQVRKGHVCLFGDSLTHARVYRRLTESALGVLTVAAHGFEGGRTDHGPRRIAEILDRENPEYLLVLLGTNNLRDGMVPEKGVLSSWMSDLEVVAAQAHRRGTVVLFGTIPPRGFEDPESRPEAAYNRELDRLGERIGVPVAPIFERLQTAGERRSHLAEDGIHWRPAAMKVAAEAWADTLGEVEWLLRDR